MTGFDTQGIEELLARTRGVLDTMRHERAEQRGPEPEWQVGEALDGQVRAAVANGRVQALRLSPGVRRPAGDLAAHVVSAVNQALGLDQRAGAASRASTVDGAVLWSQLRELQDQSVRQMREFGTAMDDVLARIRGARG